MWSPPDERPWNRADWIGLNPITSCPVRSSNAAAPLLESNTLRLSCLAPYHRFIMVLTGFDATKTTKITTATAILKLVMIITTTMIIRIIFLCLVS